MKNKHIERIPKRLRHIYLKSSNYGKADIPQGRYCYSIKDGVHVGCPYWRHHPDKHSQSNGYCQYLHIGDWYGRHSWFNLLWDECKHKDCRKENHHDAIY